MRVLLIDLDGHLDASGIPNLALMKLSWYHKKRGDTVGFDITDPDKVYISCIFTKNAGQARGIAKMYPNAEIDIGGSGISLSKTLPDEIEHIKPDYDLYPSTYSQDFTSRGCIRKCPFCFVPEKEGLIKTWHHPSQFHDDRFDTCMIMDNNLFAAPQSWQDSVLNWFIDNKIKMIAPQGWDVRLLNPERAALLKSIKHVSPLNTKQRGTVHFAWDNLADEKAVERGIQILKDAGFNLKHDISFYVLAGFNTTFSEDVYRCNKLRELGVNSFVMPFKKTKEISKLMNWCRPWAYWDHKFEVHTRMRRNKR